MAVGAISAEIRTGGSAASGGAAPVYRGGLDFGALLRTAGTEKDGSKTEIARNAALSGPVRVTTIRYSDGTSEMQTSAAGEPLDILQPGFAGFAPPVQRMTKADSDLDPETGADRRGALVARWYLRPAAAPAVNAQRPAEVLAAPRKLARGGGAGRLFDRMV